MRPHDNSISVDWKAIRVTNSWPNWRWWQRQWWRKRRRMIFWQTDILKAVKDWASTMKPQKHGSHYTSHPCQDESLSHQKYHYPIPKVIMEQQKDWIHTLDQIIIIRENCHWWHAKCNCSCSIQTNLLCLKKFKSFWELFVWVIYKQKNLSCTNPGFSAGREILYINSFKNTFVSGGCT